VVRVPTSFGAKDPEGKFIEYLPQSRPFAYKIYVITQLSWIRRTISAPKVSGTEMDTSNDNGRYQNSKYDFENLYFFGFS
jgi:hypothetical protein